jgi:hypothetical protein
MSRLSPGQVVCKFLSLHLHLERLNHGVQYMVERRIELDRRYMRKKKMKKIKSQLETATGEQRDKLLYKMRRLSPFWVEPAKEKAK